MTIADRYNWKDDRIKLLISGLAAAEGARVLADCYFERDGRTVTIMTITADCAIGLKKPNRSSKNRKQNHEHANEKRIRTNLRGESGRRGEGVGNHQRIG